MLYWDVQKHNSRCLGSSLVSRRVPEEQRHLGGQEATEMMFFKSWFYSQVLKLFPCPALEAYYPLLDLAQGTQTLKT